MPVDERMDALTDTVEQIAGLQQKGEERLTRIEERFEGLDSATAEERKAICNFATL